MKNQIINFPKIEKKWQSKWEKSKAFQTKPSKKKKYYSLEMYSYPSGSGLHLGHAFQYTIGDIHARLKRSQGFNVLHPTGFDSFGLPAENAAAGPGLPHQAAKSAIGTVDRAVLLRLQHQAERGAGGEPYGAAALRGRRRLSLHGHGEL